MQKRTRKKQPYQVYVRDQEGQRLLWTETATADADVADEAIHDLLTRPYFTDKPLTLVALYRGTVYFTHDFEESVNAPDDMHRMLATLGRVDWLRFPSVH